MASYLRVQLDGGVDPCDVANIPTGQWLNIQVELDSSSTVTAADGGYKIWVNNNNYNSPSAQYLNIVLSTLNWKYVFFGAYNNNGLAENGIHSFQQTDFEVSSEYDPNWNISSGPAPARPLSPSNLRIVQ